MIKLLAVALVLTTAANAGGAMAAERAVTMAIQNMTCAACPYIVQKSMSAVSGVEKVEVSFEDKTATVTFDDTKTTVDAIASASKNAGYPAIVKN
ncbi:MAG: mercury resistance system periplasmic binding protein MerP [Rhodospirillaceae bacterium]|nr:MAG: mercury resistance system periplasmic binding protein MerP [Rhodospirillaceae bacterium]